MGRVIRFLFQLFFVALVVIVLTVVWICFDGLNDVGGKTDVALAVADPAKPAPVLDRAAKLFVDGDSPMIIVTGSKGRLGLEQLGAMRTYLQSKGVPEDAIIAEGNGEGTIPAIAHNVAGTMKDRRFKTVTIVEDYVTVTRTKLALYHEGIGHTHKVHVGELKKEDSLLLAEEVFAVYDYIGRTFLVPGMSELKKEAGVAADKAKEDAHEAKEKVERSLDKLPR